MTYKDSNTVVLEANGTGGLSEIVPRLKEDGCSYFLIRIPLETSETAVAAGAEITLSKIRDCYVAWTGPKVGKIERGKKSAHFGQLQELLSPSHAQLLAVNPAAITEENLKVKSDPKAGSHILD